uniref:PIPK domain-containing protein n=1 Tax=Arcella intermedia TaxID=1963864 RepID=A0A6B2L836_9EUKA
MCGIREACQKPATVTRPNHFHRYKSTSLSKPVDTSVLYDYEVIQKISIKDKDQPNENWNFEAYAPRIFSRLRLAFGVNESAYVESLSQESLIKGLISGNWKSLQTLHNSGRSGSFIFKTHDDFLYVKSLPLSEWTHFRNILQDYYNYMVKNTDTLLTRFYGLYSITPPPYTDIPMITFIVMENCLSSTLEIDELYDLKGSTVNRSTPMDKRGSGVALKDLDYDLNKRKILIPEQLKRQLYNQIESDTKFLLIRNILDYSLLLGISYGDNLTDQSVINNEKKKSYQSIFQRDNGGTRGTMTRQIHYFFGIIDILTQWDINKMSEYGMKTFLLLQDSTQISAVKPPLYHKRFMDYMDKILKS